jgi:hypothetical protein
MTLAPRGFLSSANIQDNVLRYRWDDWKSVPALEVPDEKLEGRFEQISQRSILAFECATAEWVVHRFGRLENDPAPLAFIQAAWAMTIHPRYSGYGKGPGWQHLSTNGWEGPIRRPIKKALDRLEISIEHLASEFHADPSTGAALLYALAAYVMNDPEPYERWAGQVFERFESLYPRDPNDPLGDPVPREATDPLYPFQIEQTESFINQFLSGLDYRSNMFLSTPEGMLSSFEGEPDFPGTPYRFDLALDRRTRNVRQPRVD